MEDLADIAVHQSRSHALVKFRKVGSDGQSEAPTMIGLPDSMIAERNKESSRPLYAVGCTPTEAALADWPQIVTLEGSPVT